MSEHAPMSLDAWVALSTQERNRLIGSWFTTDRLRARWRVVDEVPATPLHDLLSEAAQRFQQQYGTKPLVTNVGVVDPDREPETYIVIYTKLSPHQRVEELPSQFMTFPVRQQPMAFQRWGYAEAWRLLLRNLAGWREEEIDAFVVTQDTKLWRDDWIYHESPVYWIARLLVPPKVWESADYAVQNRMLNEVCLTIGDVLAEETHDWQAAKVRLGEAIERAQQGAKKNA